MRRVFSSRVLYVDIGVVDSEMCEYANEAVCEYANEVAAVSGQPDTTGKQQNGTGEGRRQAGREKERNGQGNLAVWVSFFPRDS